MKLCRVLPYDDNAAPHDRGGVLYAPGSTDGRIANPDLYHELYLAVEPEAAVAEVFGRISVWRPADFIHANGHPYALVTYDFPSDNRILNLDDVSALLSAGIRSPSSIVTRNRAVTRGWSRTIFLQHSHSGVSWWSFHNPDWTALALWDLTALTPERTPPQILTIEHPLARNAARFIVRQVKTADIE